jgi:hypothetical protein
MARFKADVEAGYELLTAEEKASVLEHVLGYDHPWHFEDLAAWASEGAGGGAGPAAAAAGGAAAGSGVSGGGPLFASVRELFSASFFKAIALEKA